MKPFPAMLRSACPRDVSSAAESPVQAEPISKPYDLQTCVRESRRVRKLPPDALIAEFCERVSQDRGTTVELLIRMGAIDERQLYKPLACASMYAYCRQVMRMSENAAFQRIRAARAGKRFPQVLTMLADGRLHLTAVALLNDLP